MEQVLSMADGAGRYLNWGFIHVSVTNALLMLAVLVLFVLALVVPFPHGRKGRGSEAKR